MPANYVLLGRVQLNAPVTSVTFSNIPQTGYTDLKIVTSVRTDSNAGQPWAGLRMSINGSTSNLLFKAIYGDGSSASSGGGTNAEPGIGSSSLASSNAFGNSECYIANYTSSAYKPFSARSVQENNGSTALAASEANLWSNTAAITSLTITNQGSWNFVQYSTFSLYGLAALGTTPTAVPKASGGDIVVNDGTYWYHAFLSTGTFTPSTNLTADAIIVGAGGSGGTDVGGGAGAGRVYAPTAISLMSATSYACVVGAGAPASTNTQGNQQGTKGTDSSLFGGLVSYISLAGGGGNSRTSSPATLNNGWNGGGGSYDSVRTATAGNGGFAGGSTSNPGTTNCQCGGGGGASEAGNTDASGEGGDGTNTYSSWASATSTGVSGFYAGGGGGGYYSGFSSAPGGSGGGGSGGNNGGPGAAGTINTGSGGGGGGSSQVGGAGGSGIVIVRYTMA